MTWWFHLLVRRVEKLQERAAVFERVLRAVGTVPYQERCERVLILYRVDCTRVTCEAAADKAGEFDGGTRYGHEKSFWPDGSQYAYGRTARLRTARGLPVNIERDQGCWRHGFVRRDPYQYDSIFKDDPGDYMGL